MGLDVLLHTKPNEIMLHSINGLQITRMTPQVDYYEHVEGPKALMEEWNLGTPYLYKVADHFEERNGKYEDYWLPHQ